MELQSVLRYLGGQGKAGGQNGDIGGLWVGGLLRSACLEL